MGFLLIRGGRILRGKHWIRANILVNEEGRIIDIFKSSIRFNYYKTKIDKILNAKDKLILPGRIDLHVHFREPGEEYKETFETGSAAAIAGGTTIIGDMPNNKPPINTVERFKRKKAVIEGKSYVDYVLYMGVPDNFEELKKASVEKVGIKGIKIYYYNESDESLFEKYHPPKNFLYIFHAEDRNFLDPIKNCNSYDDFESSRPAKAEYEAVRRIINIAKRGYRVHITHISTYMALEALLNAKRYLGDRITFDVTPHHLILSKEEGNFLGPITKCYPPLRSNLDKIALTKAFRDGLIDAIASDHAPHALSEKKLDFCEAKPGIAAVQYVLPIIYTLFRKLHIKDPRILIRVLSEKPAQILGLKNRGKIKVGYYADLVIFNHRKKWRISPEENFSKNKETPYDGMIVRGYVEATILRGEIVYEDGVLIKKVGKFINNYF